MWKWNISMNLMSDKIVFCHLLGVGAGWWERRGVDLTLARYQEHLSMEFKNVSLIFLQSIENAATSEKKLWDDSVDALSVLGGCKTGLVNDWHCMSGTLTPRYNRGSSSVCSKSCSVLSLPRSAWWLMSCDMQYAHSLLSEDIAEASSYSNATKCFSLYLTKRRVCGGLLMKLFKVLSMNEKEKKVKCLTSSNRLISLIQNKGKWSWNKFRDFSNLAVFQYQHSVISKRSWLFVQMLLYKATKIGK